jgi:hypothetical protein
LFFPQPCSALVPSFCKEAKVENSHQSNRFDRFMSACVVKRAGERIAASELYRAYVAWETSDPRTIFVLSEEAFMRIAGERLTSGARGYFSGLSLRDRPRALREG